MKKCKFCAEEIQDDAIICKYCKSNLGGDGAIPTVKQKSWFRLAKKDGQPREGLFLQSMNCGCALIFIFILFIIFIGILNS